MRLIIEEHPDGSKPTRFRYYDFRDTAEFGTVVRLLLSLGVRFEIEGESIYISPRPLPEDHA